jgi:hypothetical protein
MPWHFVAVEEIDDLAARAGLRVHERWQAGGRWFAQLRHGEATCRRPG